MKDVHDRCRNDGQLNCKPCRDGQNAFQTRDMGLQMFNRLAVGLVGIVMLGGCLPYTLYHRAGVTTDTARGDEVACGRIALAQAPVAMEREIIPGDIVQGPDICDAQGRCRPGPVREIPDRYRLRDVNEDLRNLIARQCMAERGYDRVTLPACSDAIARSVAPAITRVMPKLTSKACVIRRGGESYQIVPG